MNTYVLLIFRCSEQSLHLDDLRELLPSRCTLGLAFCQGTCHAIGRRDGKCQYGEVYHFNTYYLYAGRRRSGV